MNTFNRILIVFIALLGICASCGRFKNDRQQGGVSEPDSLLIMSLADSAWYLSSYGDMKAAENIAMKIKTIADTLPEGIVKGDAWRSVAMYYNDVMDFENAITFYDKAESVFKEIEDSVGEQYLARTWLNRSLLHYMGGDYLTAIEYCSKAEPVFVKYKMNRHLINLYSKLSEYHDHLADTVRSSQYYLEVIKLTEHEQDFMSLSSGYLSYAIYLMNHGQSDESESYLQKMKALADSIGFPNFQSAYYINMGFIQGNYRKDYHKALEMYFSGLEFARQSNNPWSICDMLERVARTYINLNQPDKAIPYGNECLQIALEMNNPEYERKIRETLYNAYQLKLDYKNANIHLQRFLELWSTFVDAENQKQINYLTAKNEVQRRELKIAQLETEQQRKEATIATRTFIALACIGLLLIIAIYAAFTIRNLKQKKLIAQRDALINAQKIIELEKEKELIAVHSTLKGEEAERSRIARDLHDGLGGLLSGVKLTLNEMKGPHIISEDHMHIFNHAIDLIDTSARELRRVAHNMMPEILHKAGLNTALNNYCDSLDHQNVLNINYNFFGSDIRLNPGFELAVYRMAQELVNNAIKHAKASRLDIQLIIENERLCLTVADDGQGFDMAGASENQGKGLTILRSRVASFGGRLDVNTALGQGAEFMIEFLNPTQISSND